MTDKLSIEYTDDSQGENELLDCFSGHRKKKIAERHVCATHWASVLVFMLLENAFLELNAFYIEHWGLTIL